jgi:hypothetical protein
VPKADSRPHSLSTLGLSCHSMHSFVNRGNIK